MNHFFINCYTRTNKYYNNTPAQTMLMGYIHVSVHMSVRLFTSCQGHKSYIKGQGHSEHIPKIRVWAITPDCFIGYG